jgi:hypothetical protein
MSCAGHNSGYQEVLCPVLEITVDIMRSYVLCWKLLWISWGLMSCVGNYRGYKEVLCPLPEITLHITRTCVLCSKCSRWTPSTIHICRCTSWRTFYLSPSPPPQGIEGGEVYHSYVTVASFKIPSISAFVNHTTFRHCSDTLTVSQPDVHRITCALRFAFFSQPYWEYLQCTRTVGIGYPPLSTRHSFDQGWPMSFLRSKFHMCGLYRVIAHALTSIRLVSWSI